MTASHTTAVPEHIGPDDAFLVGVAIHAAAVCGRSLHTIMRRVHADIVEAV